MNNNDYEIKMDGKEHKFGEATRYTKEGKGRFDLIPSCVIADIVSRIEAIYECRSTICYSKYDLYVNAFDMDYVDTIIYMVALKQSECSSPCIKITRSKESMCRLFGEMIQELAIHFQKGAEKYGERNCEKGIPLWSFMDSGLRHMNQWFLGISDENHYISAIWNFVMAIWTIKTHPERCVMPGIDDDPKSKREEEFSDTLHLTLCGQHKFHCQEETSEVPKKSAREYEDNICHIYDGIPFISLRTGKFGTIGESPIKEDKPKESDNKKKRTVGLMTDTIGTMHFKKNVPTATDNMMMLIISEILGEDMHSHIVKFAKSGWKPDNNAIREIEWFLDVYDMNKHMNDKNNTIPDDILFLTESYKMKFKNGSITPVEIKILMYILKKFFKKK